MSCKACRNDVGRHDADCVYSLQASGQIPTMSKARQAAEERWPSYPAIGFSGAEDRQVAFLAGVAWALPENPDPAVIEAMAKVLNHEQGFDDWVEANETQRSWCLDLARAAYVAMRGAMQ